jgi:GNAT superfamily N-acetyltransferase
MADGLGLRTGYFGDAGAFQALADLLRDTFDIDVGAVDRFGGQDPTSMPSGYFDADGQCVANFSAFSMPLVIGGEPVRAVGYQSGAVRPQYRGRGLYRDLMQRTFNWADAQGFECGILLTDKPGLYEPHGFRTVAQHFFRGEAPAATLGNGCRRLSIDTADDVEVMRAILARRSPASDRFAVAGHGLSFLLNCCFDPDIRLSHMADHDAVVAWKLDGARLKLLDVVAEDIPDLARIVAELGVDANTVEVYFPPDKLGWHGAPIAYQGSCALMVAGDASGLARIGAFMLSPMADF